MHLSRVPARGSLEHSLNCWCGSIRCLSDNKGYGQQPRVLWNNDSMVPTTFTMATCWARRIRWTQIRANMCMYACNVHAMCMQCCISTFKNTHTQKLKPLRFFCDLGAPLALLLSNWPIDKEVLGELRGDLGSCFEMLGHATLPNAAWGGAQLNASVNTIRLACPVPKKSRSNPQTARQKQEGTRGRWGIEQRENQGKMTPELFKKKKLPYWSLLILISICLGHFDAYFDRSLLAIVGRLLCRAWLQLRGPWAARKLQKSRMCLFFCYIVL